MIQIDMEMPKNCYECKYNLCVHYNGIWADDNNRDINCTNSRHKDCPLKEVSDKPSGKWEQKNKNEVNVIPLWKCSVCGAEFECFDLGFDYCPHCGTKMMESEDKE